MDLDSLNAAARAFQESRTMRAAGLSDVRRVGLAGLAELMIGRAGH
jgi:hypothetical protein